MTENSNIVWFSDDLGETWDVNQQIVFSVPLEPTANPLIYRMPYASTNVGIWRQRLRMWPIVDYTVSGIFITFAIAPLGTDDLKALIALPGLVNGMQIVLSEIPTGAINGTNVTFDWAHTPTLGPSVFRSRLMLIAGTDCSTTGNVTTVDIAPRTGELGILGDYAWTP
jgi:hypothetical protein